MITIRKLSIAALVTTTSFLAFPIKAIASPVHSQIKFGSYINCVVVNHLNRPIRINFTHYYVTGYEGPASKTYTCANNCFLSPGGVATMSGPRNHHNITRGSCTVDYSVF